MSIVNVHHLNCASFRGASTLGHHLVCHVLLLETSRAGLVLVDTGLGSVDYADMSSRLGVAFARGYARPLNNPTLAAVEQIQRLGFAREDVRHIVLTHLDLDHVGGLSDFPDAEVHVYRAELQVALERGDLRSRLRYRPKMWAHEPKWRVHEQVGEPWLGFEGVRDFAELDDAVLMVPLIGHSRGHVGVAIDTADGWLLDAGDAYFDRREIKQTARACSLGAAVFQTLVDDDRTQRRENQDRLRSLHTDHPEVEIFCAHDPFEYRDSAQQAGVTPRGLPRTRS